MTDDFEQQVAEAIERRHRVKYYPAPEWSGRMVYVRLDDVVGDIAAALRAAAEYRCEMCATFVSEAEAAGLAALKGDA